MVEPFTGRVNCRPLLEEELPQYLHFAGEMWGPTAPQASETRVRWLYQFNPNTKGFSKDLFVGLVDNKIVGGAHRMRLPWRVHGERTIGSSGHDLGVLPAHQSGLGALLALAPEEGEEQVLHAGLSPTMDQFYGRLKAHAITCCWQRKALSYTRAAVQLFRGGRQTRASSLPALQFEQEFRLGELTFTSTSQPPDTLLERAVALKVSSASPQSYWVDWDKPAFAWRFFHPLGPRHVLILASTSSEDVGRMVVSFGRRKRLRIARFVDAWACDERFLPPLLQAGERVMKALGASAGFSVTSWQAAAETLSRQAWSRYKAPPGVRLFRRKSKGICEIVNLWGGAWDFGCDASE